MHGEVGLGVYESVVMGGMGHSIEKTSRIHLGSLYDHRVELYKQ